MGVSAYASRLLAGQPPSSIKYKPLSCSMCHKFHSVYILLSNMAAKLEIGRQPKIYGFL